MAGVARHSLRKERSFRVVSHHSLSSLSIYPMISLSLSLSSPLFLHLSSRSLTFYFLSLSSLFFFLSLLSLLSPLSPISLSLCSLSLSPISLSLYLFLLRYTHCNSSAAACDAEVSLWLACSGLWSPMSQLEVSGSRFSTPGDT